MSANIPINVGGLFINGGNMNREKAIEIFKRLKENAPNEMHLETVGTAQELFDMAIQALSQEPCDDLISREAVIEILRDNGCTNREGLIFKDIRALPPVTQKSDEQLYKNGFADGYEQGYKDAEQKSGKWIPIPYELDYETDAECSLCHEKFIAAMDYNYCPKCGCRMQKSEDEG